MEKQRSIWYMRSAQSRVGTAVEKGHVGIRERHGIRVDLTSKGAE